MPGDSGVAFVVVVHLSPEHESHLSELLQPHVGMPVQQVTGTVLLEADNVYVIPPNRNLSTIDTHLRLTELEEERRERAPVDHFFRTLARTHDGNAIGVVLTGTGRDGALGIKEIKENGGLVVVQDPAEAEYEGMPLAAVATGLVDLVLPLEEIPEAVLRFVRTAPAVLAPDEAEEFDGESRRLLQKIFAQIRARTDRDFSHYKRSTLRRRIGRRMQLHRIEELSEYLELLRDRSDEARDLAEDLLITVTRFFRDLEVFETLREEVIPELFEGKGPEDEVRVWSVGCATGEEAYSFAILLLEEAARREFPPALRVFASDLHEGSLEAGRRGFFPGDIEQDVTPERLQRFFVEEEGGYRIRKEVREILVFAPHDLLADPPFSRLDLISCRNLLIYLQREIQRNVVELLHYALRSDGYLVLGTSESVEASDLFLAVDRKKRVFRKRNVPVPEPHLPVFSSGRSGGLAAAKGPKPEGRPMAYGNLHQRMVELHAPPSVLVSPEDKVVHLSERAGRYLVQPGGEPTANLHELVRDELRIELQAVLREARDEGENVRSRPLEVRFDGDTGSVVLDVRPAPEPRHEGFLLLIFEERPVREGTPSSGGEEVEGQEVVPDDARVRELEAELDLTRERLRATIEEYQASREEMRSSNEELQSTNEELRSTMEELETSKEELQSMNEELQTVNQENRHKVEELSRLTGDLQNLLSATEIATLFLDRDLQILRFTAKATELFNLRHSDRGRPITDLTHRLGYDELRADAGEVLQNLAPVEREIQADDGCWYVTRILPYRSVEDRIEGVVVTFVEITERKEMEKALRRAKNYAEAIAETLHHPLLVLTADLTVQTANPAFYDHFQVDPEETEGRLIYELGNHQWEIPALRELLEDILPEDEAFEGFEVEHEFETIGRRVMLLNARRLVGSELILLGIRDVTDRRTAARRRLVARLTVAEQEERRRISRILHDDVQQVLHGIEMKLGMLEADLEAIDQPRLLEDLQEIAAWLD
ncbi:MAG: CheR family methyltransferase, partial [Thermoanaerobaculia bacterium]|nr:CheR family methyltransferase [Thermoanaerobaculia bacterium]